MIFGYFFQIYLFFLFLDPIPKFDFVCDVLVEIFTNVPSVSAYCFQTFFKARILIVDLYSRLHLENTWITVFLLSFCWHCKILCFWNITNSLRINRKSRHSSNKQKCNRLPFKKSQLRAFATNLQSILLAFSPFGLFTK